MAHSTISLYIIGIDQSTQGTKALLFDAGGTLVARADKAHRQIVNDRGWVEHDPEEIFANTLYTVRAVTEKAGIDPAAIAAVGISNQRETSLAWDKAGKPLYNAIVWQDARAEDICRRVAASGLESEVQRRSGIRLSPYFPAAKLAWLLQNVPAAAAAGRDGSARMGTVDSFLVYRLTGGRVYKTDCSNASRTQLFNIRSLAWDKTLCDAFGVPLDLLPAPEDSDGDYGETDLGGFLPRPVPIRGVLGDSHGALLAQGCLYPGMAKATYGTGSSCMMNVGAAPVDSGSGLVSSLAWRLGGRASYVLEGNINYTGAVISWLKNDLGLIASPGETGGLARAANPLDRSYLVPAFSGLGAPYWNSGARAAIVGMSRTTGKKELVRAAVESIAYQIADVILAMEADAPAPLRELRADGGPTANGYLMQFQSDILRLPVAVSPTEELSGMGAAYAAGSGLGLYDIAALTGAVERRTYAPAMAEAEAAERRAGWRAAVGRVLA